MTTNVLAAQHSAEGLIVWLKAPSGWKLRPGESVSVDGVCSTVQDLKRGAFKIIYMAETLKRSTLAGLARGGRVNVERSLTPASLIGGHLIQGHVDATARISEITNVRGGGTEYTFKLPARLSRYVAPKGSVAVDGISLTVVNAAARSLTVSLLDYTLQTTTLGAKKRGDSVNIEVDILARYVERLLAS